MKNAFTKLFLILSSIMFLASCKDSDDGPKSTPYDPSKPTELLTFFPERGKYLEKVILKGKNFGNDPTKIKVYFNERQAPVIGSDGEAMYALAPRLPVIGAMDGPCNISVVIGEDSLTYPATFEYKSAVSVTTIAGNGEVDPAKYKVGTISESVIQPRFICIDKDDNLFVVQRAPNNQAPYGLLRIDEVLGEISELGKIMGNVPAADPVTGMLSQPTEAGEGGIPGTFITYDPREFWGPRFRTAIFKTSEFPAPTNGWKHSMVVNPEDRYIYTRYYHGELVKIHPTTFEAEVIAETGQGDSFGLTFVPGEPNILYIAFSSGENPNYGNSIVSLDVTDPANTIKRLSSPNLAGGHRDGRLDQAQFRSPSQIFSDADGNIYVADRDNHCIRRITPEKMVETTLGIPGVSGWKDGSKEEALFNQPTGLGISSDGSVYVADWQNARVRKLSIN